MKYAIWLLAIGTLSFSCKKSDPAAGPGDPYNMSLIVGPATSVWRLSATSFNGANVQLCNCAINNNRIAFYADGSYTQSLYICQSDTGFATAQVGLTGKWSLNSNNILSIGTDNYSLITISSTSLIIDYIVQGSATRYYYVPTAAAPFLTAAQQLGGSTGSKTWKYSKTTTNGAIQALTPDLLAARFTYTANGSYTSSFTNSTYGQPITGSYLININNINPYYSTFALTVPGSVAKTYGIEEFTPVSFIYTYYDTAANINTIYYVIPQ